MAFILIVTTLASSKAVEDEPGQAEELIQENRQTGKCAQRTGGKSFWKLRKEIDLVIYILFTKSQ